MADEAPERPRSRRALFWAFTWLALQGFGGVVAVVQRELIDRRRWLTREQFVEDWAVAQTLPGPNVVNLSLMIGARHFGLGGGLAALAGMLSFPTLLLLLLVVVHAQVASHPVAAGALRGMGAVAAGLIVGSALRLLPTLRQHPVPAAWCGACTVLAFLAVVVWRWPLVWVLVVFGGASWVAAYLRLPPEGAP